MNTIQEAIDSGACTHLGPVNIDKNYGTGTNPRSPLRLMIRDESGKTLLKLWGSSRSAKVNDGDIIELRAVGDKGLIETQQDQQGRNELSANNVAVQVVGAGTKATVRAQARQGAVAAKRGPVASMKDLIDYGLACVNYARKKGETDSGVLGNVFGSAMYGFKEGRALVPEKVVEAPPPPQQSNLAALDDVVDEEEDDIPF